LAKIAGRYELCGSLGGDNGGAVFKAYDRMLDRLVAVKLFELPLANSTASTDTISRFRVGAKAGARLSHPYIVPVFDYGETLDHAWIVMELVEGLSLKQVLDRSGRQTMPRALRLMEHILSALEYAHEHGVIHRNVKPGNVILTTNSVTNEIAARLTDFGIPRGADDANGTVAGGGTDPYMAPEQLAGHVDRRADIWAAGVVFYELLTGQNPFAGGRGALRSGSSTVEPEPPSKRAPLPPVVDPIVAKALAKHPADRYQSAAEFIAALRALEPITPSRDTPLSPVQAAAPPQPRAKREHPRPPAVGPTIEEPIQDLSEEPHSQRRRPLYAAVAAGLSFCTFVAVVVALNGDLLPAQQSLPSAAIAPTPPPAPVRAPASVPPSAFASAAVGAAAAIRRADCALLEVEADDRRFSASGVLRDTSKSALLGTLDAFGLPSNKVQLDLQTFDADLCQVLQTVRPVAVQGEILPRLALSSPDPLPAGQNLRFRVRTPDRPTYLHILFFGSEGQVGNMVQSDGPLPASSSLEFGEPYWTAAPPYGTGLLVAITSDRALYAERRPAVEASSKALDALASAIHAAQDGGERIEARVITATSLPPS
jgi:serine/threonine protein kinase